MRTKQKITIKEKPIGIIGINELNHVIDGFKFIPSKEEILYLVSQFVMENNRMPSENEEVSIMKSQEYYPLSESEKYIETRPIEQKFKYGFLIRLAYNNR